MSIRGKVQAIENIKREIYGLFKGTKAVIRCFEEEEDFKKRIFQLNFFFPLGDSISLRLLPLQRDNMRHIFCFLFVIPLLRQYVALLAPKLMFEKRNCVGEEESWWGEGRRQ